GATVDTGEARRGVNRLRAVADVEARHRRTADQTEGELAQIRMAAHRDAAIQARDIVGVIVQQETTEARGPETIACRRRRGPDIRVATQDIGTTAAGPRRRKLVAEHILHPADQIENLLRLLGDARLVDDVNVP